MKIAVGLLVLLNWEVNVLGPLTVQAPVPLVGVFAANVAVVLVQIVCAEPALEAVGAETTVSVTGEE